MRMQGWGVKTIGCLGMFAGWFLACAGDDIPPVDDELRETLAQEFGGAPTASAGSAGSAAGGRSGSGAGRSGSGNSGSANAGSANSGGGAAGDGGEPVGGGGSASGEVCDAFPILQRSCGLQGCHTAGVAQGAFAVSEDDVQDFVDAPSKKGASACDQVFIDSSNPEDSLIYTRLFAADCGGTLSMPLTGDPLTEEESDCVLSWLGQFAQ